MDVYSPLTFRCTASMNLSGQAISAAHHSSDDLPCRCQRLRVALAIRSACGMASQTQPITQSTMRNFAAVRIACRLNSRGVLTFETVPGLNRHLRKALTADLSSIGVPVLADPTPAPLLH